MQDPWGSSVSDNRYWEEGFYLIGGLPERDRPVQEQGSWTGSSAGVSQGRPERAVLLWEQWLGTEEVAAPTVDQ